MKIEIVKGAADNPVAEFFSSSSTPETDANEAWPASKYNLGNDSVVPAEVARRLEREIQKLRYESQREAEHHDKMVGELEKVYAERDGWAALCGQYKQERDKFAELSKQASQGINSTYQNIQYLLGALIVARNERDGAREMLQQYMFDRSGTWIDFLPADKPTP